MEIVMLIGGMILLTAGTLLMTYSIEKQMNRHNRNSFLCHFAINSMPELLPCLTVVVTALFFQKVQLGYSIIIGLVIFQQLLVLGVSAMNSTISLAKESWKSELTFQIFSEILLVILSTDYLFGKKNSINTISRIDGMALCLLFVLYVIVMYQSIRGNAGTIQRRKLQIKAIGYGIFSVLLLCTGSVMLLHSIEQIAIKNSMDETMFGITIGAVGIGLPMLIGMYQKLVKSHNEIIMESAISGNITVLLLMTGILSIFEPVNMGYRQIEQNIILAGSGLLLWVLFSRKKEIGRRAGCLMTTLYIAFIFYVFH